MKAYTPMLPILLAALVIKISVLIQTRAKWTTDAPNIKIGDMVVVKDNQSLPASWRLGRIVEVTHRSDDVVRVVKVLTAKGEIP